MTQALDMDTVNYSEMRRNFASHLKQCATHGKKFRILRNGKAEGILVSMAEWQELVETLSILTDPRMMKQIVESEKDIRRGRVHPLDEAFEELLAEG